MRHLLLKGCYGLLVVMIIDGEPDDQAEQRQRQQAKAESCDKCGFGKLINLLKRPVSILLDTRCGVEIESLRQGCLLVRIGYWGFQAVHDTKQI